MLVLEIADESPRSPTGYRSGELPARLDLHAWVARLRGEEIRYDWDTQSASGFKRFERETNSLSWYPYKSLDGDYEVEVTYSCADSAAGSKFRIVSERRGTAPDGQVEGVVEKTQGKFVTRKLAGKLTVKPQTDQVTLSLMDDDKSAAMKVRKITLIRSAS